MQMIIKKVYRQHTTLHVSIAKALCLHLDIKKGDYLCFELAAGRQEAKIYKIGRRKEDKDADRAFETGYYNRRRAQSTIRSERRRPVRSRLIDLPGGTPAANRSEKT